MKSLIAISLLLCSFEVFSSCRDDNIRKAVDAVVGNLPSEGKRSWPEYIISFGYHYRDNEAYPQMAEVVSNNFKYVYENFSNMATNAIQRLIILSAGWAYDEDYYIESYSKILDLAIAGQITKQEFRWFECAGGPTRTSAILSCRYKDAKVRDIISRYQEYSGNTNRCEYILSGRAKRDSELHKLEMLGSNRATRRWILAGILLLSVLIFYLCVRHESKSNRID